ncbi:MAG TPA: peroxiredoxin [Rhodocyclaceae bacterium]|nr:peroxiredoxin [Rhodocyclaceae bacterium]HMV54275.1 peroxiredoxin [Rhodocyclaceae bacterium]HMZ83118.1 peroxiredoxin [Rhodocyclaceae bacterium]HNA03771.1 peroxiredoxin [Rhodocyclaceae bacterium]HNB78019.1 peroxiredoxin [Rhodocyclaceae bacterium]
MAVLVGKPAPDFSAAAVTGNGEIGTIRLVDLRGRPVVLFFYPLDFTFVCPSELIAFDHRMSAFESRGATVLGCSVDSVFTHLAWRNTPVEKGGIGPVRYALLADVNHAICRAYDVENADGVALRGTFLIDGDGIVQHQVVNNLALGRDIDEMLRVVDAHQFATVHGEVCPAGWKQGRPAIKASPDGIARYLAEHAAEL